MNEYTSNPKFIDLQSQQLLIRSQIDAAISRVLSHGQYIMGPEVLSFERKLSNFTGSRNVVTCANGTDALSLVLMAWGLKPGEVVFVPSFTYVATAEAPSQLGGVPFFVDVCNQTFNMDVKSLKKSILECKELGLRASAVIVVDLFGQPSAIDEIYEVAKNENLMVLVDGAQSFGGSSKGRPVGKMGDATTTSFFPSKPLGCYGDGGAILTDDDNTAEIVRSLSLHGKGETKYDNVRVGMNSRLDTIQAAILIEKLSIFSDELIQRNNIANYYRDNLNNAFSVPLILDVNVSSWAQYTVSTKSRDHLKSFMKDRSIPTEIYYPRALSQQKGYSHYPAVGTATPVSYALSQNVLSIPMHPYMRREHTDLIISTMLEFSSKYLRQNV